MTIRRTTMRLLLAGGAGAMALGMAACSSNSSSGTTATTAATSSTTGVTTATNGGTTATTAATTSTTAASGTLDSCNYVTQAEASSAFGQTVTAGVLGNATVEGGKACVFYGSPVPPVTDPDVATANSVRVVVVQGSDATTWFNDYKSKHPTATVVSGYGDQAFFEGASLSVLKANSYLRVAVVGSTGPSLSGEEQLATAVLPGLKG